MTMPSSSAANPGAPSGELPDRYDPASTESAVYAAWESAGLFTASAERGARGRAAPVHDRDAAAQRDGRSCTSGTG